ncbi:MAG: hypothetical protein HC855_05255 [Rhizobiales bacterium]|nr:hypothetical protein [Hyphomicrobiales bacterium]
MIVGGLAVETDPLDIELEGRLAAGYAEIGLGGVDGACRKRGDECEPPVIAPAVEFRGGDAGLLPTLVLAFGEIEELEDFLGRRFDKQTNARCDPGSEAKER